MNKQRKLGFALVSLGLASALELAPASAAAAQPETPESPQKAAESTPKAQKPAERSLTDAEVVTLVMRHNPDLTGAALDEKQAAYAVRAEEARYPLVLSANAGYTRATARTISLGGLSATSARNTIVIGSDLRKDFATGTLLTLSVQGEGSGASTSGGTSASGSPDTAYTFSTRVAATQPLLRGAWTKVGEAGLRTARIEQTAAREGRARITSEVVRDALLAYWELWYAGRTLAIEHGARQLAVSQLAEAKRRQAQGALAGADVLAFETRVVSLDETITSAELTELQRTLDLAQVLGVEAPSSTWSATTSPPEDAPTPSVKEVETKLATKSPELAELEARVAVATERAAIAGDAYRPRLDVEGYVEVRGTASGSAGAALAQLGSGGAVGGYVGVFFETPLTGGRESIEVETARVAIKIAQNQLATAKSRLNVMAARLVAQVVAAKARRAAAEQTVTFAVAQHEAERARFTLGTSTPIQVQEAEDAVRRARLRAERARVDLVQAILALDHAAGDLTARYPQGAGR